jgi:selenide,water dikinase
LPKNSDPNLLVGFETSDDAGVYRLTDDIAIVTTADFITPPVNDPYRFGQIAAANAISDVYAMGGRPITCINLAAFPSKKLGAEILQGIVAGALDKITEAGAVLAGGHTTEDEEPKFGLAVTGIVHPEKIWTNTGAKPGDVLVLTKPLGSGVLFNANLKGWVSQAALDECVTIITELNKRAAEIFSRFTVHAVKDVTGFGLAGHGYEIATASDVALEIEMDQLPIMREALEMYEKGMTTGVNAYNRKLVESSTDYQKDLPQRHQEIVFDPQTSGGLMAAVTEDQGRPLLDALHDNGVTGARIIGKVIPAENGMHLILK